MSDVITFRGSTIFTSASTGVAWAFTAGTMVESAVEERAPLGTGYWVKPGGYDSVQHTLDLSWVTATPATVRSAVEALADVVLGDLVVPVWGTFSNCRLSSVGEWRTTSLDGGLYAVSTTLTFTEYP